MVGCSAGTITNVWSSIEERHRRFRLAMPLGGAGEFERLYIGGGGGQGDPVANYVPNRRAPHQAFARVGGTDHVPGA